MQRKKFWVIGGGIFFFLVFCIALLLFSRASRKNLSIQTTRLVSSSIGVSPVQLEALDRYAQTYTQAPAGQVRDTRTGTFVPTSSVIFEELQTLPRPFFEPLVDQQGTVLIAFTQSCTAAACTIGLYRDPQIIAQEGARSFITAYMNTWYALTHTRPLDQAELRIYFMNRDRYIHAALGILTPTPPAPRSALERALAPLIPPVEAAAGSCDNAYECGTYVSQYKCPDGATGTCLTSRSKCEDSNGVPVPCEYDKLECITADTRKSFSTLQARPPTTRSRSSRAQSRERHITACG